MSISYTTSDVLGGSGAKIDWSDSKGNNYKVSLLTLEKQSAFERWLEREAVKSIKNVKDILTEIEYQAALSKVLDDISSGRYVFGGEDAQNSLTSFKGMCAMISVLFEVENEQAVQLVKENTELPKLIENIILRSFPVPEGKDQ
jgi:hypothetical protein